MPITVQVLPFAPPQTGPPPRGHSIALSTGASAARLGAMQSQPVPLYTQVYGSAGVENTLMNQPYSLAGFPMPLQAAPQPPPLPVFHDPSGAWQSRGLPPYGMPFKGGNSFVGMSHPPEPTRGYSHASPAPFDASAVSAASRPQETEPRASAASSQAPPRSAAAAAAEQRIPGADAATQTPAGRTRPDRIAVRTVAHSHSPAAPAPSAARASRRAVSPPLHTAPHSTRRGRSAVGRLSGGMSAVAGGAAAVCSRVAHCAAASPPPPSARASAPRPAARRTARARPAPSRVAPAAAAPGVRRRAGSRGRRLPLPRATGSDVDGAAGRRSTAARGVPPAAPPQTPVGGHRDRASPARGRDRARSGGFLDELDRLLADTEAAATRLSGAVHGPARPQLAEMLRGRAAGRSAAAAAAGSGSGGGQTASAAPVVPPTSPDSSDLSELSDAAAGAGWTLAAGAADIEAARAMDYSLCVPVLALFVTVTVV
jgi:hypothetical protein